MLQSTLSFLLPGLSFVTFLLQDVQRVSAATTSISFPEQPSPNATKNIIKDNFIGISYELASFDTLWGKTTNAIPAAMQNYMSNLNARMTNPLRIRIGGNAMDGSTYVPSITSEMLMLTDPNAYFNDIPADFGPVLFDVMNGMADKAGEMEFIIGLSMRDPNNETSAQNVRMLAKDAHDKLGVLGVGNGRLDALLLGNEPDLYAGHGNRQDYNISIYIPEIAGVLERLRQDGILEKPLIGGPTICCSWDLGDVIEAGLDKYDYKYYTLQHYPNNACSGLNARNTNVSSYASHYNLDTFVSWNDQGINLALVDDVPVILTEYNSVSCGGSNISNLFVMSLWGIDAGLKAISRNLSAVYLHTREYGVQYNLFDPPMDPFPSQPVTTSTANDTSSTQISPAVTPTHSTPPSDVALASGWKTGSTYYAALFLSEIGSAAGNVVVDLNLNNSIWNPTSMVAGYGTYTPNHNGDFTRDKLILLNYADKTNPVFPANGSSYFFSTTEATQTFQIPGNIARNISYRLLTSESLFSTTNTSNGGSTDAIKWAGQYIGSLGNLRGQRETKRLDCWKGCKIEVPSPGAAMVLLTDDDGFYEGNSTIISSLEDSQQDGASTAISSSTSGARSSSSSRVWITMWIAVILLTIFY